MGDSVSLSELEEALVYRFKSKPLLIGGAAMEHYRLRKRGADIDLVVTEEDYQALETYTPPSRGISTWTWVSVWVSTRSDGQ